MACRGLVYFIYEFARLFYASTTLVQWVFNQNALGPKDRYLIAPSREGGETISLDSMQGPKGRHKSWRTFGAQIKNRRLFPPLRDGAINYRSFGPGGFVNRSAPNCLNKIKFQIAVW